MTPLFVNPILTRELRARWRGGRSMFLVFGYVSLLSITAGLVYAASSISNDAGSMMRDMAELGHNLFLTLSGLQIVAWMLIAPSLTATSIAGEREHGLLELLQLTPLSPWRICSGKMGSALLLVVLLMFAPLPVTALCFLLGGVSPGDFCIALAMQIATVFLGLSLGLWASSRSRRALGAITSTFVVVIAGFLCSFLVLIAHESRSPWCSVGPSASTFDMLRAAPLDLVWRVNPLLIFLLDFAGSGGRTTSAPWLSTYVGVDWPDWVLNVAVQLLAALALSVFAVRTLSKPFADAAEDVVKTSKKRVKSGLNESSTNFEYSKYSADSVLKRNVVSNAQSDSLWWQWNWLARFCSPNPMLEREVRRRARWRRSPRRSQMKTRLVALGAVLSFLWAIWRWLEYPFGRSSEAWVVVTLIAFIVMFGFSCVQGAIALTREHEAGTWEGIQLSLLSPSQILWGKLLPPFGVALLIGAAMWMPTILCIDGVFWSLPSSSYDRVTPERFIGTLLIAVSVSWVLLCWGIFLSSHLKRVWPAIAWTIGSLLFFYVVIPILLFVIADNMHGYRSGREITAFVRLWHPAFALSEMWRPSYGYPYGYNDLTKWNIALNFTTTVFGLSLILLFFTHRQLARLVMGKNPGAR